MTAEELYRQFGTPKNLQAHMLAVASLVCEIRDYWIGEEINWDSLIIAALLHDLGNVIKFDLDKLPDLLGEELPRIDFWRQEQKRLIEKYGDDDHVATGKMLDEIGIDPRIKQVIQTKSFGNIRSTATSNDWLPKILQYCDLRISPYGLMELGERMKEIKERYEKYAGRPDFSEMVSAAKSIEEQINENLKESLNVVIKPSIIEKYKSQLFSYDIQ